MWGEDKRVMPASLGVLGGSWGATHSSPLSEPSGTGLPWMADFSMM